MVIEKYTRIVAAYFKQTYVAQTNEPTLLSIFHENFFRGIQNTFFKLSLFAFLLFFSAQMLPHFLYGFCQAVGLKRLQEVVEGIVLERFNRVLVVSGGENYFGYVV